MKRAKATRMRGRRTHGYGSQKKHRGAGSRGGRGFGGSFKHKRVELRKKNPGHFRKQKFKSLQMKGIAKKMPAMNLRDLPPGKEVDLTGYKILSAGTAPKGIVVKATAFSPRAKEKIEAAGGKAEEV